ncbi:MAG: DUF881 domain-containing protein [Clostridia bacterium]|nr:DUF881 domain-containing protein [Clostridia bacterium]
MSKKAQAIVLGIMCLVLTIGICVQIKITNNNGKTNEDKEINNLKTQVLKIKERYNESFQRLTNAQNDLEKVREEVANSDDQLKEIKEKIEKYNTLLGLTDIKGQGVKITISDANIANKISSFVESRDLVVTDVDILEMVNELKNAGAEAIDVNGERIISTTSICYNDNNILINGKKVSSPITINAIGFYEGMTTINRPGGYLDYWLVDVKHLNTTFKEDKNIIMKKYIGLPSFKYAKTFK